MLATLEEVKDYLRIDYEEDDAMLTSLQIASESYLQEAVSNFEEKKEVEGFRQKAILLQCCIIQDWYDNREQREQKSLAYTTRALMLQLQTGGA